MSVLDYITCHPMVVAIQSFRDFSGFLRSARNDETVATQVFLLINFTCIRLSYF
jgi:hypothetical protein